MLRGARVVSRMSKYLGPLLKVLTRPESLPPYYRCSATPFRPALYVFIKLVFLSSIFLFEVGSLIRGVAQNSVTLIAGRAVAGIGSAGIFSGALTILAYSVPLAKRPVYSGAISSMYGVASISGPLMGGAFTD
jgi:Arabinose efflux permease